VAAAAAAAVVAVVVEGILSLICKRKEVKKRVKNSRTAQEVLLTGSSGPGG
jgi:hypothetical protein